MDATLVLTGDQRKLRFQRSDKRRNREKNKAVPGSDQGSMQYNDAAKEHKNERKGLHT